MNTLLQFGRTPTHTLQTIGDQALRTSRRRYSSGFPHYQGGVISKLGFNNARHSRVVGDNAARLARFVGLSPSEQALARVTGYAHDIVQLKGRGVDERESAEWIEERLRAERALPPAMAKLASKTIIATEPTFRDGIIVRQKIDDLEFDSPRDSLFAACVVAADLSEVYMPLGPYLSHKLYAQQQGYEADEEPPLEDLLTFQHKQIRFLATYRYPLQAAEQLFAKYREQVIDYAEYVARQLTEGSIGSWQQLLEQDIAFSHHPNKVGVSGPVFA